MQEPRGARRHRTMNASSQNAPTPAPILIEQVAIIPILDIDRLQEPAVVTPPTRKITHQSRQVNMLKRLVKVCHSVTSHLCTALDDKGG